MNFINNNFVKLCPSYRDFNVFGLNDKGCCYCYGKYCSDVSNCSFKTIACALENEDFIGLRSFYLTGEYHV